MPKREGEGYVTQKDQLHELAKKGANYVRLKKEETNIKGSIKKENDEIKSIIKSDISYDINGKHKEVIAPLGDGMNEVFFQIQTKESISMVDNIVDLVRKKLGDKADTFIMKVEVLHENSLEAMKNQGLITDQDIIDWTSVKATESLVVKMNKIKK